MQSIPGVADAHLVQVLNYPALQVDVDRLRAAKLNVSQRDVANNMLTTLSSSSLVAPNFFLNPQNNVNYFVAVQTPIERINSVGDLMDTPVDRPDGNVGTGPAAQPAAPVMRLARHRIGVSAVDPGIGQPLHGAAGARHRRQCRWSRPRLDRRRHPAGDQRDQQGPADHHEDPDPAARTR